MTDSQLLARWYHETVQACDPREATRVATARLGLNAPVRLIAVGKAAVAMAHGARDALHHPPLAGLVVSPTGEPPEVAGLRHVAGDHPVPAQGSAEAAAALDALVASHRGAETLVLVSGGTTSLIAAPRPPLSVHEMQSAFDVLLGSGADIDVVNAVRRRLLQWGGGRLAAALAPSRVSCLIVSDVMSGDVASIGSGPCAASATERPVPDALRAALPERVRTMLDDPLPALPGVRNEIILDNRTAVASARQLIAAAGVLIVPTTIETLDGEASLAGAAIGRALSSSSAGAFVLGGETTVTLTANAGRGGRCQELALAAARELRGQPATLLAAGTDGRDGPTDAAGAIVDGTSWERMIQAGRDPAADLAAHRAYDALAAIGALIPAWPSGTNVNDLVIGLRRSAPVA
ncbi:MAG: DUF4147 domain-containing protein [Gemmatimonadetes bacterium]|nr:DUF4147 domain-containing protein [Gemmatimonadota bacterium]